MAVYAMAERKQPSLAIVTSWASICFSRGVEIRPDATASLERRGWNHAVAKFSLATPLPQECNYGFTRVRARLHNSMRWQVQPPGPERGHLQPSQNHVVDTITAQTLNYAL